MFSDLFKKFDRWMRKPHYLFLKDPLKLTLFIGIIAIVGASAYYAHHSLKADELETSPKIKTFKIPEEGGYDYLVNIEVENVANVIPGMNHWTFPNNQKAACIITNGVAYYPLFAPNNSTSIYTTIHRDDFSIGSGYTEGFVYDRETLTINCANKFSTDNHWDIITNYKAKDPGQIFTLLHTENEVDPNTEFDAKWYYYGEAERLCYPEINAVTSDLATEIGEISLPGITDSKIVPLYCRDGLDPTERIDYITGRFIFVRPPENKYRIEFTAPKEVKPNTQFEVQYSLYDPNGQKVRVGPTCLKSSDWRGSIEITYGKETISGWASGSKKFGITCLVGINNDMVGPVYQTVTVVDRNLKFSIDGKDVPEYANDYQMKDTAGVNLAWQYTGPTTDICTAKAIKTSTGQAVGKFNGQLAFSGQMYDSSITSTVNYSITCATENRNINVLIPPTPPTPPPPPPPTSNLTLNINPTDYSAVSTSGIYQLKKNQFTANWKLTPSTTGTPCTGSGDITSWNIKRAGTGSQLLSNVAGTKTLNLTCLGITKSIKVNYTVTPTPPPTPTNPLTFTYTGNDGKISTANDKITSIQTQGILNKQYTLNWSYTPNDNIQCKMKYTDTAHPLGQTLSVAHKGRVVLYTLYPTETRVITCGTSVRQIKITTSNPGNIRIW